MSFMISSVVHAEIKTYTGIGDYLLTEDDPSKDIKAKAKLYAKRNALERAGVFIQSYSKTKNLELIEDEIISITGTIMKIVDTTYELIPTNDKIGVGKWRATVVVEIDTDKVDAAFKKWLGRDKKDRSADVKQVEELRRIIDEQNKKIAALEEKVRNVETDADNQEIREEIATIDKEMLYAQKIDEAQKLNEEKKYADAVKVYTEAIEIKPDSADAYLNRGHVYCNLEQNEHALRDYNKAIELNPNDPEAYNDRGSFYEAFMKNIEAALANYNKSLQINPNFVPSYIVETLDDYDSTDYVNYIHSLYYVIEDYERAIEDYTKLIKLYPNDSRFYNCRASFYEEMKNYDAAIRDFDKAIQLDPNSAWAYKNRGNAYCNLKQYERAIQDFDKAIQLCTNYAAAYNNRGNAYKALGDETKAQADFAKAKELGYKG
ncbi:MAG: tetratricopeptide repeat protein [Selenomonadaceae bacterium]|nr:tetratricopeptide repeat protein [Selenomonadaceae bacterium]